MRRAALLLLLLPLTACSSAAAPVPAGRVAAAAQASLAPRPGPSAAAARLDAPVPRGTVTVEPGPFSDRFRLTGTRLAPDGVHTRLDVVSDVSDLLALEVDAAFYDASGHLLGTGRTTRDDEQMHGTPGQPVALLLPATAAWRSRVASAVLSVPVLVNE